MPHTVGCINGYNHSDSSLTSQNTGCFVVQYRPKKGKGDQGKYQATQKKQKKVFQSDLAGTNHQGSAQQLHGRPVRAATMALMEKVDDYRHGYACSSQSAPQGQGIEEVHG
jgi:hypothetical protein